MKKLVLIPVIIIYCFSGFKGFTQSATIQGTIVDSITREPMPFVNILLKRPDGKHACGTASKLDGKYIIKPITPGQYDLMASSVGYKYVKIKNITLVADSLKTVDFEMSSTGEIFDLIIFEDFKVGSDTKDHNFIKSFNQQIDSISLETTVEFLNTFSRKSDNAEYLEYRNKTLFKLLKIHPDIYLSAMCQISDTLQWMPILSEIESPVSDEIDVASIRVAPYGLDNGLDECQENALLKTIVCLDKASLKYYMSH